MRLLLATLSIAVFCGGCTHTQLRHSTGRQVNTLSDLQHQMVLDNLAAFNCNKFAIPSQVILRDGATQVTDSGTGGTQFITDWNVTLGASRTLVDQWGMVPVTDDTTLKLLQIAYRRAYGTNETLYENWTAEKKSDFANDLAHDLKKQTAPVDDLRTINEWVSDEALNKDVRAKAAEAKALREQANKTRAANGTLDEISKADKAAEAAEAKARKLDFKNIKDSLDQIISSNAARIVQEGETLNDDNLVIAPVMKSGVDPQTGLPVYFEQGPDNKLLATPIAAEVRRQVMAIAEDLGKVQPGWFGVGCKKDVPKCACYVGHHCDCEGDCYVWVIPERRAEFEQFTLKILNLSSRLKESQVLSIPGVRYSPTNSRPR